MDLFGFINKKNYCYLFYVLGSLSFLLAIISFLTFVYIVASKKYMELWNHALVLSIIYSASAFENYILFSMCQKLITK